MMTMRITYDKEADAAYIQLARGIKDGEVKKTQGVDDTVFFDYDKKGNLLGIEILEARKILSKKEISTATKLQNRIKTRPARP